LAGRVAALLDVDRQREEVELISGLLARRRRRQDHRLVVEVGDGRACRLLGEPPGLETNLARAEAAVVDDRLDAVNTGTLHWAPSSWSGSVGEPRVGSEAGLRSRRSGRSRQRTARGPLPRTGELSASGRRPLLLLCDRERDEAPLPGYVDRYRRRPSRSMSDR